jgi:hypothetical protein
MRVNWCLTPITYEGDNMAEKVSRREFVAGTGAGLVVATGTAGGDERIGWQEMVPSLFA